MRSWLGTAAAVICDSGGGGAAAGGEEEEAEGEEEAGTAGGGSGRGGAVEDALATGVSLLFLSSKGNVEQVGTLGGTLTPR